jgi:cytidylate kinase
VAELTRVVALDGPAGSGKSTVARATARALGWRFVDTGATYRAVTLHVLRAGVDLEDQAAVAAAAEKAVLELETDPARSCVRLDGEDVSAEIRGPAVTAAVSAVSAVPAVRRQLIVLQRRLMGRDGAVVEGRDIATVVAPQAAVKVYLDARPEVRARRRAGEHAPVAASSVVGEPGEASGADRLSEADVSGVERSLQLRDELDSRTNALIATEGAVHLDTSELTVEQVVAQIVSMAEQAGVVAPARSAKEPRP